MKRRLVTASVIVLLAATATACRSGHLAADAARLTVSGRAEVASANGPFRAVGGSRVVHTGDRIRMSDGTARLELGRGGRLELRAGTELQFADPVALRAGDVLVEPDRRPLPVATDDADVRVENGATAVSRTFALSVSTYRGAAVVGSPGATELRVRAPRQATIPARGVVPARPEPLRCDGGDPWQQRFLAASCDLGGQLAALGAGMAAQLPPGEGHTPGFFRLLVPTLEGVPDVDTALDLNRDPGDNLLASVIAAHAKTGTFGSRVHDMFAFRDQGEDNWGLVALDQGVSDPGPLNADLEAAVGRAPKRFEAAFAVASVPGPGGGGGPAGTLNGGGQNTTSGTGPGGSSGGSGPNGGSSPSGPTTTQPPTTPTTLPAVPGVPTTVLPLPLPIPVPSTLLPSTSPTSPTSTTTTTAPATSAVDPILDPLVTTVTTVLSTLTTLVGGGLPG